ncbi:serine threonine kinase [Fusarium pseudocircinatum]|uniref:Serine threonine kinase n=1 Tax=Fusarium pseudocircinatum TaxID=56676 RepID=A0A8H5P9N5_9HYPO|nr:serine threonine kinase [Fusarium pseudocircinatum]
MIGTDDNLNKASYVSREATLIAAAVQIILFCGTSYIKRYEDYSRDPKKYTHRYPISDPDIPIKTRIRLVVEYLHGQGLFHTDIKPRNIMIRSWSPINVVLGDCAEDRNAITSCGHLPFLSHTLPTQQPRASLEILSPAAFKSRHLRPRNLVSFQNPATFTPGHLVILIQSYSLDMSRAAKSIIATLSLPPFDRLPAGIRKMIHEFAVAADDARILPECKSMSKPGAKASVCMELLSVRLVSHSFHATINNIFPYAGKVVLIEDSGAFRLGERWTSKILFDPKRDILRISSNRVPRLKRCGEVEALSRSLVRYLMLAQHSTHRWAGDLDLDDDPWEGNVLVRKPLPSALSGLQEFTFVMHEGYLA